MPPENASVESGFSINKDMLLENLNENSPIVLCMVYNSVKIAGGIESVKIYSEMLQYAKLSKNRYNLALEERKKKNKAARKLENENKRLDEHSSS